MHSLSMVNMFVDFCSEQSCLHAFLPQNHLLFISGCSFVLHQQGEYADFAASGRFHLGGTFALKGGTGRV